jgi:ABC-type nitrate/sulfonate/bicarbonate transport system substrate-binding protein
VRSLRLIAFTIAFLLCASIANAQTIKLRASYAGTTGYHLPIWVQKQETLDKKYGLDMELLLIGGGARVIQALLGGDLQLTHSGASCLKVFASCANLLTVIHHGYSS